jgi:hypothetical protein
MAYLDLGGSHCAAADVCGGNEIILCHSNGTDAARACPPGKMCLTNGQGNRPLGYDSCQ